MSGQASESTELLHRTKQFALRVVGTVNALPNTAVAREIGRQFLRAGTSVGSNYRAACRARSTAEFVAKLGIVEEEADESQFWMELLIEANIVAEAKLAPLYQEAEEILSMVVASIRTARRGGRR